MSQKLSLDFVTALPERCICKKSIQIEAIVCQHTSVKYGGDVGVQNTNQKASLRTKDC